MAEAAADVAGVGAGGCQQQWARSGARLEIHPAQVVAFSVFYLWLYLLFSSLAPLLAVIFLRPYFTVVTITAATVATTTAITTTAKQQQQQGAIHCTYKCEAENERV